MALQGCKCENGLGNTGLPNCIEEFGLAKGMFLVPLFDSTGVRNSYPIETIIPIDLDARVKNIDASKRWYPIHDLKDAERPKEETQFQTFSDASKARLRDGLESFSAKKLSGRVFTAKLQQSLCKDFGVVLYDEQGKLLGTKIEVLGVENFAPIPVEAFDASFIPRADAIVAHTLISFNVKSNIMNKDFWLLPVYSGAEAINQLGWLDANVELIGASVLSVGVQTQQIKVYNDFGSGYLTANDILGLNTASISAVNLTTNTVIVGATLTSNVAQTQYALTFPVQVAGNIVRIKIGLHPFEGLFNVVSL